MVVPDDKHALPPDRFGLYEFSAFIGEGGYGCVFAMWSEDLGRRLAAKVLLHEHAINNPEAVRRFKREAAVLGRVQHPGIVKIENVIQLQDGRPAIIMEYLDGQPLSARLAREGGARMSVAQVVPIVDDICAAVSYAHSQDVVHRDLKPENIFFHHPDPSDPSREVLKVLDFGIAKMHGEDASALRTRTGEVLGTCQYMAPEQILGDPRVDHRADVYSLGIIVYELLTGKFPFRASSIPQWIHAHTTRPPKPFNERLAELGAAPLSAGWQQVIDGALAKDPDERFASVEAFQQAVNAAAAGEPVQLPAKKRPASLQTMPAKPTRKRTLQMTGATAASSAPAATNSAPASAADVTTLAAAAGPSTPTQQPNRAALATAAPSADAPVATMPPMDGDVDQAASVGAPTLPPTTVAPQTVAPIAEPVAEPERGRRRLVVALGLGLVVSMAGVVFFATRGLSSSPASVLDAAVGGAETDSGVDHGMASIDAQRSTPVDAAVTVVADAHLPDATPVRIDAAPIAKHTTHRPKPRGKGTVAFRVTPWAMVYVDGQKRGSAPTQLTLSAGWHRIKLQNTQRTERFKIYVKPNKRMVIERTW